MTEVTRILSAIEQGEPHAAEQLLPLVYSELRRLAAQKLAHEKPGQTLQATALVHEAYLQLVDRDDVRPWNSRFVIEDGADPLAVGNGRVGRGAEVDDEGLVRLGFPDTPVNRQCFCRMDHANAPTRGGENGR